MGVFSEHGVNRSAWRRLAWRRALVCYVTVNLMTLVERPSNGRRIEVDS